MSVRRLLAVVCSFAALASAACSGSGSGGNSGSGRTYPRTYVPLVGDGGRFVTQQAAYSVTVVAEDGSFAMTPAGAATTATAQFATLGIERGATAVEFAYVGAVSDGQGGIGIGRGEVLERLQALPQGLELTWTFPAAPAGSGDVAVRVSVGGLEKVSGGSASTVLRDPASGGQIRVGQALWVDAAGKTTALDQELSGGVLTFRVPEAVLAASTFPAMLDPVVSPATIGQVAFDAGVADGTIRRLTVGKVGPGSVTSDDDAIDCGTSCSASYTSDSVVTLTATPTSGAIFVGWSGPCAGTGTCTVSMSRARFVYAGFEPATWPVRVVKVGGGGGTVTGSGMDCPASSGACTVDVPNTRPRTRASFTATADGSSIFRGWSVSCGGTGTCELWGDRPKTAFANFVPRTYPLTVATAGAGTGTVTGGGISCASGTQAGCSATVQNTVPATQVTLTAAATGDSIFAGWSGACTGMAPACTVTMDMARSAAATFLPGHLALAVQVTGAGRVTGAGLDCTSYSATGCTVSLPNATTPPRITLTATADAGATFAGWSGPCGTAGGECTFTVERATTLSATFHSARAQLAVLTTGSGGGTVTGPGIRCTTGFRDGCSTLIDIIRPPQSVTLRASADGTSLFAGWSGSCGGTGDCTVSMDQARTAIATFKPRVLNVQVQLSGSGGTVSGPGGFSCSVASGCNLPVQNTTPPQQVTLTASPANAFVGWSGQCSGSGISCTLTVDDNKYALANFIGRTPATYSVGGSVTGLTASGLVLRNNGADDLSVGAPGTFAFPAKLLQGASYAVTVWRHPAGQTCAVANGSGVVGGADVISIAITCAPAAPPTTWSSVTAFTTHSAAIRSDGTLWAWGSNSRGELGDGTQVSRYIPVQVGAEVSQVGFGFYHSVALKTDGTLWAAGWNELGSLGDGTTTDHASRVQVGSGFAAVTAGEGHTLALRADGTLWAWGYNAAGQVGDGTLVDRSVPVQVLSDVVRMAAGWHSSAAIRADGTLWTWGRNDNFYGALGMTGPSSPVPVQVGTGYARVAVGQGFMVALKADGSLWTWGSNQYGQLGDDTGVTRSAPAQVGTERDWARIAATTNHAVALKTDGTLWAWGNNAFGQIGDGTTTHRRAPVLIGSGYVEVAAGSSHTLAIKSDGSLWAWGSNSTGYLGDATTTAHPSPARVGVTASGPPVATTLVFTQEPPHRPLDLETLSPPVTVSVLDQYGAPFTTGTFTVSLALSGAGATGTGLNGSTVAQTTGGTATFADLSLSFSVLNSLRLVASAPGLGSATTGLFYLSRPTHAVGGMVTGLVGSGLVLRNNGADDLAVLGEGTFSFRTPLEEGTPYEVTVAQQPAGQTCSVNNGSGTVGTTDVSDIDVTCAVATHAVSGSVTGLTGSGLVLTNSFGTVGEDLAIASNGTFQFLAAGAAGSLYAVAVTAQPTSPWQTCTVTNGSGLLTADVTDVAVACTTNAYLLGGTVTGLLGSGLVLASPSAPDRAVAAGATSFQFSSPLASGTEYAVAVKTQPVLQTCTVATASGTIADADVDTVRVSCACRAGYALSGGACVPAYRVGGTVAGLYGSGLTLATAGQPDLAVAGGATSFDFGTAVPVGTPYDVTIVQQPSSPPQVCAVVNGTGTVGTSDVTDIAVSCRSEWAQVAAGGGHSLGLRADGTLWAWGNNDYGQLGDGTTANKITPVQVGSGFAFVAAGTSHSVAVKTDGTLWTWGYNGGGQLGDGTSTQRLTPVQVGGGFASAAAGDDHTVALRADGTLWAWGSNSYGQLGNGATTSSGAPIQVGNGFASVAAGYYHTVGVKTDGTLWAWGAYYGTRDGATEIVARRTAPVQLGSDFASVAAGESHAMAVKTDGTLWAWGWRFFGQLGNTGIDGNWPAQVGGEFASVAAGRGQTVALKADGTLWAWGRNVYGQLGDGTTTERHTPVLVGSGFASVATGGDHTVALKTDGTLWTWGRGGSGQLGNRMTTGRSVPMQVRSVPPSVAAGTHHSAVVKDDGTLWTWGNNQSGQLGDGSTTTQTSPVRAGSGFTHVAAGGSHTVALHADGTLWTWGENNNGELGEGTTVAQRATPAQVGSGFAHIAAGYSYSVALKTDGTLWAWGNNVRGQLGDGTTTQRSSPVQVGSDFASVAAGYYHTLALKNDGTLWGWGHNTEGELGDGTNQQRLTPVQVGSGFASMAAGNSHSVAVKADGTLWAWGWNAYGQLGDGSTTDRYTPVLVGSGFASVAAGDYHTLAVKTDGTLWAWGSNANGQLGDGTTTQRLTPVQVGRGFASVAAGYLHALAVKTDGTFWAWGFNGNGRLGDGTTTQRLAPVQIDGGLTVNAGWDQAALEGTLVRLSRASFADWGGGGPHAARITWGDGTPVDAAVLTESGGYGLLEGSHVYADNGTYTVSVCVQNASGASGCDSVTVTVNNAVPVVSVGPNITLFAGITYDLALATFTDRGAADTHVADVDLYNDGTWDQPGVVSEAPFGPPGSLDGASGTVAASVVFSTPGTYLVGIRVFDDDGASNSQALGVTVLSP